MLSSRRGSQTGSVTVEFLSVFPILLLLFFGVVDFGWSYNSYIRLTTAALAGAQYGSVSGNSTDYTGMQTTATNAASGLAGFSVSASKYCACSPGGASVTCSTTCSGYGTPVAYVMVAASASVPGLFKYGSLGVTYPLKSTAILRVQ